MQFLIIALLWGFVASLCDGVVVVIHGLVVLVVRNVYDAKIGALSPFANGYGVSKYEIRVWRDEITFLGRVLNIGIKSETVFGVIFICQKCAAEKRKH